MLDCLSNLALNDFQYDFDLSSIDIEELQAISLDDFLYDISDVEYDYHDVNEDLDNIDLILQDIYLEEIEQNNYQIKEDAIKEWKNIDDGPKDELTLFKQFEEHTKSILEHIQRSKLNETKGINETNQNKLNSKNKQRISFNEYLKIKNNKTSKPLNIDLEELKKLIFKEHDYCRPRKDIKINEIECLLKEEAKQAVSNVHHECRNRERKSSSDVRVVDMDISPERPLNTTISTIETSVKLNNLPETRPNLTSINKIKSPLRRNCRHGNKNTKKSTKMASLFVGNLPRNCKKIELKRKFSRFGEISFVNLKSKSLRNSHAFIKFKHRESARQAFEWIEYQNENANDHEFSDYEIKYGKKQMKQVKKITKSYQDFDLNKQDNDEDWFSIKSNFIEFDFLLEKARRHLSKLKK